MEGFRAIFQGVGDPRKSNATKHGMIEMLAVALPATLSGSSSCAGFARYAEHKQEFLKEFMELKGGPPSHDAFSDVSDVIDPEQLSGAMTEFAKTLAAALPQDRAAVDGKALRGAVMDAKKKSALHPVQAFEPRAGLVLGQAEVDGKSNETAAIPALPELPDLDGRTAADAMHCQRETSARIVEKGGDCVLPAKGNQGTLHEDVQVRFSDPEARKEMLACRHVGGGHGRVETRVETVSHDVGWPGLKAVGRIEAVRELKGRTEQAVRHCIMSAEISPERLPELTRNRWRIENCLRWVPDVVMGEDRMRNRTLNGPECLAAIRRIALNIVRLMDDEHSLAGRMGTAGWNDKYLVGLFVNAVGKF